MTIKLNELKIKYVNMSAPLKASFWFTICNILQKGMSLLSTPIMTRILTQEQYGTFSIFQSWLQIVTIFATLNIFLSSYTKGLVQFDTDRQSFTSSMLGLTSVITLMLFGIFSVNMNFWSRIFALSPFLISLMFVEIFFVTATEFWSAKERVDFKYKKLVAVSLSSNFVSLMLGIVWILLEDTYKAEVRIISDILAKCIIGFVIYIYIFAKGKKFFDKKYWIYALTFNIPLIPHYLSHYVLNQSDRVMIGGIVGKEEAAIYSVAYSISMMMVIVINAVNNSFVPYVFQKIKDNDYISIKHHSKSLIILVFVLCILAMSFAPEIIMIFADKEYYEAIWIVPPVAISVYFIFIYSMYSNIEYYFKKTVGISIASMSSALLNIGLNLFFIRHFGYIAAGYTTMVSYISLSIFHCVFYKKIIKKEMENNEVFDNIIVLCCSILLILAMLLMLLMYQNMIIRYIFIFILAIICFVKRKFFIAILQK